MTKQQKSSMSSKGINLRIVNIIMYVLVLASIAGSYLLHSYTVRKMGMLRHIIFMNSIWEKTYPISAIKNISIILLIASIVFVFRKIPSIKSASRIHNIIYLIISVFTLTFILSQSKETIRPYYMMSICLIIASAVQFINVILLKKQLSK